MKKRGELLILHRYPYSDTSWVIKALSREEGVVSLVAKGARRGKSAMGGALEPLSYSELLWSGRPDAELGTLEKAMVIEPWSRLRGDLLKNATALTLAEIPLRFRPEGTGQGEWFDLLYSGLRWLESKASLSPVESAQLMVRYLLRICEECGVGLNGDLCISCSHPLENATLWVGEQGGFYCRSCSAGERSDSAEALFGVMRRKGEAPWQELQQVEMTLIGHLNERLGIPLRLRSLEWLQEIRRSAV